MVNLNNYVILDEDSGEYTYSSQCKVINMHGLTEDQFNTLVYGNKEDRNTLAEEVAITMDNLIKTYRLYWGIES